MFYNKRFEQLEERVRDLESQVFVNKQVAFSKAGGMSGGGGMLDMSNAKWSYLDGTPITITGNGGGVGGKL